MDPQTPEPQPSEDPSLKQIRTFQGDVADALNRQQESLVSIQQTQQAKFRREGLAAAETDEEIARRRKEFALLIVGSFFFILLGGLGAWYGYRQYLEKTAPPVILAPENRFISAESTANIDAAGKTREDILAAFNDALFDLPSGSLRQVVLRRGGVGKPLNEAPLVETRSFFEIMGTRAPGSLVRAFNPLFMLGAIGLPDQSLGSSRFLIIKLASYENAFAGMLNAEKVVAEDLAPLFSTSSLLNGIAPASVFKDVIVRNKDVRVLEIAETGQGTTTPATARTALLYSFLDNEMLIITEDLATLETLIERLTREKLSR
jgi:hypothetical protein